MRKPKEKDSVLAWNGEQEAERLIGTRVKLSDEGATQWGDGMMQGDGGEGTLIKVIRWNNGGWAKVDWDNGDTNDYRSGDLARVDREPVVARQATFWQEEE